MKITLKNDRLSSYMNETQLQQINERNDLEPTKKIFETVRRNKNVQNQKTYLIYCI